MFEKPQITHKITGNSVKQKERKKKTICFSMFCWVDKIRLANECRAVEYMRWDQGYSWNLFKFSQLKVAAFDLLNKLDRKIDYNSSIRMILLGSIPKQIWKAMTTFLNYVFSTIF